MTSSPTCRRGGWVHRTAPWSRRRRASAGQGRERCRRGEWPA
jgi:hypothetical protein